MCFAPQRRALFRNLNVQKWSENGVFCTFWLRNVLRATTACNFSSLIWPAGSAPAALASLLFDPPEPQIIGKTQCFVTFLPFRAPASSFSWLFLFSDLLSSALLFSILLLQLCFSSVNIVGSLTSKLPSIISHIIHITLNLNLHHISYHLRILFLKQKRRFSFTGAACLVNLGAWDATSWDMKMVILRIVYNVSASGPTTVLVKLTFLRTCEYVTNLLFCMSQFSTTLLTSLTTCMGWGGVVY